MKGLVCPLLAYLQHVPPGVEAGQGPAILATSSHAQGARSSFGEMRARGLPGRGRARPTWGNDAGRGPQAVRGSYLKADSSAFTLPLALYFTPCSGCLVAILGGGPGASLSRCPRSPYHTPLPGTLLIFSPSALSFLGCWGEQVPNGWFPSLIQEVPGGRNLNPWVRQRG